MSARKTRDHGRLTKVVDCQAIQAEVQNTTRDYGRPRKVVSPRLPNHDERKFCTEGKKQKTTREDGINLRKVVSPLDICQTIRDHVAALAAGADAAVERFPVCLLAARRWDLFLSWMVAWTGKTAHVCAVLYHQPDFRHHPRAPSQ